ncbi:MAG: winged helix-turn-helix domain-containing protein [Bdellovibrionales bacterium]|nr:winged helix-turn-helix domain-containing protein [Bdellovibrionales bacterium]
MSIKKLDKINKCKNQNLLDFAKLLCDRGDFKKATPILLEASQGFEHEKNFSKYLNCQNLLLRVFAEMENESGIQGIKEKLQWLVSAGSLQLNSKIYYTLALCASYKNENALALQYLEQSLSLALASKKQKEICYAIHGLAVIYFALNRLEDSAKEIQNLETSLQYIQIPELQISAQIMSGHILRKNKKFIAALEKFWQAYSSLKEQKNLYMYMNIIYAIGITHLDAGEDTLGRTYLNLVKKTIDPENLRYFSRRLDERLLRPIQNPNHHYDMIFNSTTKSLFESKKGVVQFNNQFILIDLLRLFINNPGEIYSKEALVEMVWQQHYDPTVHDNKIYVTIKRLRKLIEPDFNKPKYIFRAKEGYYFSKNIRLLLEQ